MCGCGCVGVGERVCGWVFVGVRAWVGVGSSLWW